MSGFRESPDPALAPGELVADAYRVVGEIARSETGAVFEARDMLLGRRVALKLGWRDAGTPSLVAEAKRCAAVREPCAAHVYGMGVHADAEYIVGERVTGHLLRDELDRGLPADVYLSRLRGLALAVAHAHDAGIAIGDLSGSTVLVCAADPADAAPDGKARETRLVLGRLSLSQLPALGPHGQLVAPEVARGEVDAFDPTGAEALDLYGLGCAAVELACGASPFAEDDLTAELRAHAADPPPRLADLRPDLPPELSDLVDWLLAKQPALRPRSARDVLAQLDAIVERAGPAVRVLRVLIVEHDTARARWRWSLARRADAAAIIETASEGSDAAHKLNRDQPDLVFVDAKLRGVMNALELCMYARGLASAHYTPGKMFLLGEVSEGDRGLFDQARVASIPDDPTMPSIVLDVIRAAARERPRTRRPRTTISG
jgi:serine/threonine protein kinase